MAKKCHGAAAALRVKPAIVEPARKRCKELSNDGAF
jgi:hypothetical protein